MTTPPAPPFVITPVHRAGRVVLVPPRVGEDVGVASTEPWLMVARPLERLAARILDVVVCWLGMFLVAFLVAPIGFLLPDATEEATVAVIFGVLFVALMLLYEPVFITAFGATPGKFLLKLRVVSFSDGENPPGFGRSLLRWLTHVGLGWTLIGPLADYVVMFSGDPFCRSLHDRAGDTAVVYRRRTLWPESPGD